MTLVDTSGVGGLLFTVYISLKGRETHRSRLLRPSSSEKNKTKAELQSPPTHSATGVRQGGVDDTTIPLQTPTRHTQGEREEKSVDNAA